MIYLYGSMSRHTLELFYYNRKRTCIAEQFLLLLVLPTFNFSSSTRDTTLFIKNKIRVNQSPE